MNEYFIDKIKKNDKLLDIYTKSKATDVTVSSSDGEETLDKVLEDLSTRVEKAKENQYEVQPIDHGGTGADNAYDASRFLYLPYINDISGAVLNTNLDSLVKPGTYRVETQDYFDENNVEETVPGDEALPLEVLIINKADDSIINKTRGSINRSELGKTFTLPQSEINTSWAESIIDEDFNSYTEAKYVYDADYIGNVLTITVSETSNIIKLYYDSVLFDVQYTINYALKDDAREVPADKVGGSNPYKGKAQIGSTINATDFIHQLNGFDPVSYVPESLVIKANPKDNVITIYYPADALPEESDENLSEEFESVIEESEPSAQAMIEAETPDISFDEPIDEDLTVIEPLKGTLYVTKQDSILAQVFIGRIRTLDEDGVESFPLKLCYRLTISTNFSGTSWKEIGAASGGGSGSINEEAVIDLINSVIPNNAGIVREADHADRADNAAWADDSGHASYSDSAAIADKLTTARKISLTGLVTGSANFDGSSDASIYAELQGISNVYGGYGAYTYRAENLATWISNNRGCPSTQAITVWKAKKDFDIQLHYEASTGTSTSDYFMIDSPSAGTTLVSQVRGTNLSATVSTSLTTNQTLRFVFALGSSRTANDNFAKIYNIIVEGSYGLTMENFSTYFTIDTRNPHKFEPLLKLSPRDTTDANTITGFSVPYIHVDSYGRVNGVDSIYVIPSADANSAKKLASAYGIKTNLSSTSYGYFDGTSAITIGVTGTLPVSYGGTGTTSVANYKKSLLSTQAYLTSSSSSLSTIDANTVKYYNISSSSSQYTDGPLPTSDETTNYIIQTFGSSDSTSDAINNKAQIVYLPKSAQSRAFIRFAQSSTWDVWQPLTGMCNPNILPNGDYTNPVNQRGLYNSNAYYGSSSYNYPYTIDMHQFISADTSAYVQVLSVDQSWGSSSGSTSNSYLRLQTKTQYDRLIQRVEFPVGLLNRPLTYSLMLDYSNSYESYFSVGITCYSSTGSVVSSYSTNYISYSTLYYKTPQRKVNNRSCRLYTLTFTPEYSSGQSGYIEIYIQRSSTTATSSRGIYMYGSKLEEGYVSTLPNESFGCRHELDLIRCMRYYQRVRFRPVGLRYPNGDTRCTITLPIPMRTTPTVSYFQLQVANNIQFVAFSYQAEYINYMFPTANTSITCYPDYIELNYTNVVTNDSGTTISIPYTFVFGGWTVGIELNAQL